MSAEGDKWLYRSLCLSLSGSVPLFKVLEHVPGVKAPVKPMCAGIHSVCVLACVKGSGRNHDDFPNSHSSFVWRCFHYTSGWHLRCSIPHLVKQRGCEPWSIKPSLSRLQWIPREVGITSCSAVKTRSAARRRDTHKALPQRSRACWKNTHTNADVRTPLTLPSPLCRSELRFVYVGSCIYIRGL